MFLFLLHVYPLPWEVNNSYNLTEIVNLDKYCKYTKETQTYLKDWTKTISKIRSSYRRPAYNYMLHIRTENGRKCVDFFLSSVSPIPPRINAFRHAS